MLGLEGRIEHADRGDRHLGVLAQVRGQRRLVAGADGDPRPLGQHGVAAGGDVDHVHAVLAEPGDDLGRLAEVEAALDPLGRRDAHQQRHADGDSAAHRVHDAQQEAGTAGELAAVGVGALVAQRREELVQQVAVGGVDLDQVEARLDGAHGGGGEGRDDLVDPRFVQGGGLRELVVGDRGGGHGLPAAVGACEGGAGVRRAPLGLGGGLAPGVGELDPGRRAEGVDQVDDRAQRLALGVVPQAEVLRGDAPLGDHAGGLEDHGAGAAAGEGAVVHEVVVGGDAVAGGDGVLAHGRHPDAVADGEVAQGDRGEQVLGHGGTSVGRGRSGRRRSVRDAECGDVRDASAARHAQANSRPYGRYPSSYGVRSSARLASAL